MGFHDFDQYERLLTVARKRGTDAYLMVLAGGDAGLRLGEIIALEWRDIVLEARVVYVHRSFTKGRLKCPKTEASRRAVPLQTIALEAIGQQPSSRQSTLVFPAERGGYLDLHNFRNRHWKPPKSLRASFRCAVSTISATRSPAITAISPATDASTRFAYSTN